MLQKEFSDGKQNQKSYKYDLQWRPRELVEVQSAQRWYGWLIANSQGLTHRSTRSVHQSDLRKLWRHEIERSRAKNATHRTAQSQREIVVPSAAGNDKHPGKEGPHTDDNDPEDDASPALQSMLGELSTRPCSRDTSLFANSARHSRYGAKAQPGHDHINHQANERL